MSLLRTLTQRAPSMMASSFRPIAASSLSSSSATSSSSFLASSSRFFHSSRPAMAVSVVKDDNDLRTLLEKSSSKLVIVDWTAAWCGPCRQIAPVYEQLSDEHNNVVFIKADIDVLQDASVEAGVQSVPTFHFIKNNELVAEFSGADVNKLKTLIKQHK